METLLREELDTTLGFFKTPTLTRFINFYPGLPVGWVDLITGSGILKTYQELGGWGR